MNIAITGSAGLVGKALTEQLKAGNDVIPLTHADLDITDHNAVLAFCRRESPDLIVNCAVLQVDRCERDPDGATAINVRGPRSIAVAARETGAQVLHFSTNYVFDGRQLGRAPYTNQDETHPINVYGQTKLVGEQAVLETTPRSYIVRTAWVYGRDKDSFLAAAPHRLRAREQIQAITDAFSTTTYVKDLAARVDEIIRHGRHGIYHIVNEGVCSYYDFAVEAARLIGLSAGEADRLIVKVSENDLKRSAVRPLWTPLGCRLSEELGFAPLRSWREALADYISSGMEKTR